MLWDPKKDTQIEPMLDEVGQVMWKAADYLETHRWGQEDFVLANGAVCLMGALIKVESGEVHSANKENYDPEYTCPIAKMAMDRIANHLHVQGMGNVFEWNDDDNRKKSEVIAVLRKAAKIK